ncbi:MAG TPA: hypothetical protein VGD65_03850 [Chryseosolibacter sp.]
MATLINLFEHTSRLAHFGLLGGFTVTANTDSPTTNNHHTSLGSTSGFLFILQS